MAMHLPAEETMTEAWRCAVMRRLEKQAFTADTMARYAALCHRNTPSPSACLYLFTKKRHLISRTLLFAGLDKEPSFYCPSLLTLFKEANAASLGVSLSIGAEEIADSDIIRLSSIVLFCEQKRLPVLEAILICGEEAVPLCRASGTPQFSILHSRKV